MSHDQLPEFDQLCNLLLPLGAINSPAELHGMACGKLAGGARLSTPDWLDRARDFLDLTADPGPEATDALAALYQQSLAQLTAEEFALELLLPDDDTDLGQRTQALGQWCHGFLSGFGAAGLSGDRKLSAQASEALRDLAAITQVGLEPDEEEEDEAENNFMDVSEYVRMAVITLYTECGSKEEDAPGQALH